MYNTLVSLPLLRGISSERLHHIVATTRFHFLRYEAGESVVEAGDPCTHVKFVISGSVRTSIANSNGKFRVWQTLVAPEVLAPDFLFGRSPRYPFTATALERTGVMEIDKNEYVTLLMSDEVLLFNFLNLVSASAQRSVDGVLALTSGALDERIAFWITALTRMSARDVKMECRQRDLYTLFGVSRSSFFATLDSMAARGLITYDSTSINVPDRSRLLNLLANSSEE